MDATKQRWSGLARQFDDSAKQWRMVADVARKQGSPTGRQLAEARAECWEIAADMAERWHLAQAEDRAESLQRKPEPTDREDPS